MSRVGLTVLECVHEAGRLGGVTQRAAAANRPAAMLPGRGPGERMAGETGTGDGHGRGLDPGLLLDRAFTQSAVRISLYDTDIRYVRVNQADLRALGLEDESAVIGLRPAELAPDLGFGPPQACGVPELVQSV